MPERLHPYAPVVAIDLDGTTADYYKHFEWFASLYLQEEVKADWSRTPNGEFSDALGLEKHVYRDIKLAYRQGGMKRSLPVFPGTREAVREIRQSGTQVWVATTRPWLRLDNVDPDTQFWIRRNIGRVDGLIYGEDKYADLLDIVGQRLLGVFDDLPENIERAHRLGIPAALRGGAHNTWWQRQFNDGTGLFWPNIFGNSSSMPGLVEVWKKDREDER